MENHNAKYCMVNFLYHDNDILFEFKTDKNKIVCVKINGKEFTNRFSESLLKRIINRQNEKL